MRGAINGLQICTLPTQNSMHKLWNTRTRAPVVCESSPTASSTGLATQSHGQENLTGHWQSASGVAVIKQYIDVRVTQGAWPGHVSELCTKPGLMQCRHQSNKTADSVGYDYALAHSAGTFPPLALYWFLYWVLHKLASDMLLRSGGPDSNTSLLMWPLQAGASVVTWPLDIAQSLLSQVAWHGRQCVGPGLLLHFHGCTGPTFATTFSC